MCIIVGAFSCMGKWKKFHNGFCLECGHTTETKSIVEYEKEV